MAIWDWCESELDLDVREGELAEELLAALESRDLPALAAEIAPDWDLPAGSCKAGWKHCAPIWN